MSKRVGYIKVDNTRPRQKVTVGGNLNKTILITQGDSTLEVKNGRYGHFAIGLKDMSFWQKIKFLNILRKWL